MDATVVLIADLYDVLEFGRAARNPSRLGHWLATMAVHSPPCARNFGMYWLFVRSEPNRVHLQQGLILFWNLFDPNFPFH